MRATCRGATSGRGAETRHVGNWQLGKVSPGNGQPEKLYFTSETVLLVALRGRLMSLSPFPTDLLRPQLKLIG